MGSKINSLKLKEWRSNSANFAPINPDQKFLRPKIDNGSSGSKLVKNIFTIIFIGISLFMFYNILDKKRLENNLCFPTKELAEEKLEKIKQVLREEV